MAHLKLIAAIMVALFAMSSEGVPHVSVSEFCESLRDQEINFNWSNPDDLYNKMVLSFSTLSRRESALKDRIADSWQPIFRDSDCGASSLDIIKTMSECEPDKSIFMKTLLEHTKKYAGKCLTLDRIGEMIKSKTKGCILTRCIKATDVLEFVDDRFILDYKADNPEVELVTRAYAVGAVAKAIKRGLEGGAKSFESKEAVYGHLKKKLFEPCLKYVADLDELMDKLNAARPYLKDYDKLFSPLEHKDFFRFELCKDLAYSDARRVTMSEDVLRQLQSAVKAS